MVNEDEFDMIVAHTKSILPSSFRENREYMTSAFRADHY